MYLLYAISARGKREKQQLNTVSTSCIKIYEYCYVVGLSSSELASNVFTMGTTAVLPFYTLMIVAPKSEIVWHFYIFLFSFWSSFMKLFFRISFDKKKCV